MTIAAGKAVLDTLPNEVFQNIIGYLTFVELKGFSTLSKSIYKLSSERLCKKIKVPSNVQLTTRRQYFKWFYASIRHFTIIYPSNIRSAQIMYRTLARMVPLMSKLEHLYVDLKALHSLVGTSTKADAASQLIDFIPSSLYCTILWLDVHSLDSAHFDRFTVDAIKHAFPKVDTLSIAKEYAHESDYYVILDLIVPSQITDIDIRTRPADSTRNADDWEPEKVYTRRGGVMVETYEIEDD